MASSSKASLIERARSGSKSLSAYTPAKPATSASAGVSADTPASANVGMPCARACRKTPTAALPRNDCRSSEPSPVTTARTLQMPAQLDAVDDHIDAGLHLRAQHRERGEPDAARGPSPCGGSAVHFRFALDDVGPAPKSLVELDDLIGACPLLRRIDARRTQRAVQRVVDIRSESE